MVPSTILGMVSSSRCAPFFLQDIVEFSLAHFRPDGDCHFAEHGAGVHAHIHLHDGDTRFLFAFQDGIVDRGRSPDTGAAEKHGR